MDLIFFLLFLNQITVWFGLSGHDFVEYNATHLQVWKVLHLLQI